MLFPHRMGWVGRHLKDAVVYTPSFRPGVGIKLLRWIRRGKDVGTGLYLRL